MTTPDRPSIFSRRIYPARLKIVITFLMLALTGCGYSQSGKDGQSLYRQSVHSISIPIATSKSFHRGVEFQLTQAVIQEIEALTPYKIQPKETADTILEIEITDISTPPLSNDFYNNIPQEQQVTLTVNFIWKDLRTGQIIEERRNLQPTSTFYPTLGETEFVGTQLAVEQLAVVVAQELERPW